MTGKEFKRIRTISGFTAKEFAEYINMSTSHVYSLEQYYDKHITPRREQEFKEFLGITIFNKSKRIYELEIAAKEKMKQEQEEARIRQEKEEEEQEERQRILRQQQLEEKKIRRDAELDEHMRALENRLGSSSSENSAKNANRQNAMETIQDDENGGEATNEVDSAPADTADDTGQH